MAASRPGFLATTRNARGAATALVGVQFAFPTNAVAAPRAFLVVAKNPGRLAAITAYGLAESNLYGPWTGRLDNEGETIRLKDAADETVDAVNYSSKFPWAIGANSLGAEDEWTGLNRLDYQYR